MSTSVVVQDPYPKQTPYLQQPNPLQSPPPVMQTSAARAPSYTVEDPGPSYLPLSLFAVICCCWPIGIFAVRSSVKAKAAYAGGDYKGGKHYAKRALMFSIASIIFGIILIAILIAVFAFRFAVTSNAPN